MTGSSLDLAHLAPHGKDTPAMKNLLFLLAVGVVTGVAASAAPPPEPAAPAADKQNLDVQYAKTYLQLAQLELQRATNTNRQVPGTFTKPALDALQQFVQVAQQQLAIAENKQLDKKALYLISAEANAKASEAAYARILQINRESPGAIAAMEVERLRLTAQLARLSLDKARNVDVNSPQEYLQWEIDQLREDVFQLRNRVAQISRMN
jgi:hypothetical protein